MKTLKIAGMLGLGLIAAWGCGKSKGKGDWGSKGAGQRVTVTSGDIRQVVQATGNVEPLNKVSILPPVTGRIDKIQVYEGEYVKRGQVLAYMSSSDRAALLDTARAKGPDELKYWEDAYRATPIVAPANGLIIARNIVEGQTVSSDTDLYDLSDRLVVLAYVDETDLGKIHIHQSAACTVDAYPSKVFESKVSLIGHQAIKVNNVISYQVNLEPQKEPGELRAGMTADVNFIVQEKKGVLTIPNYAVKGQQDGVAVLKVFNKEKKAAEDRSVTLGISDGISVEVKEGLEEGDVVLVSSLDLPNAATGGPMSMTMNNNKGQGQNGQGQRGGGAGR
jgi:macrolide-specific efflux system membrane fusion protein